MNVRTQLLVAVVSLGAPLAALASTPATAGESERAVQSGALVSQTGDLTPAQAAEFSARFHEAVVHGASYNDGSTVASQVQPAAGEAGGAQVITIPDVEAASTSALTSYSIHG